MKLLTLNETRNILGGRSRSQFYRDIESGHVPSPRYVGNRPYWLQSDIEKLIATLPTTPTA